MSFHLDYTNNSSKSQIPNPPGYTASSSRDVAAKATPQMAAAQAAKSNQLRIRRAWDLAFSPAKSLPMQGMMLYFSGSGIQIFSLGMIFTLLTGPINAVSTIFKSFEALRPTVSSKNGKDAGKPSYGPLTLPMLAYIASQGLVAWIMEMLNDGYITHWIWGLVTVRNEVRATRVVFVEDFFHGLVYCIA